MILGMRQQMNGASPSVLALFLSDPADYETLSTLTTMPTGGAIARAGQAMVTDSTGRLTYAPNNILVFSELFDNGNWYKSNATVTANVTTSPDGSLTADKLVVSAVGGVHYVGTTASLTTAGTTYTLSVYAKAAENSWLALGFANDVFAIAYFNLSTGVVGSKQSNVISSSITSVGNGWYRCSNTYTVSKANPYPAIYVAQSDNVVSYTGDGTSGIFIWGAQLEAVTYPVLRGYLPTTDNQRFEPRFDVDPLTGQPKGLLVEGARTNVIAPSNGTTWNAGSITVTGSAGVSPDGTNNAIQLTATGAPASYYIQFVGATATTYTGSIWVKRISGTGQVKLIDASGARQNITITSSWQRYTATAISVSGSPFFGVELSVSGDVIQIFGGQTEVGNFATSYIPTTSASVARAAETFTLTGYANRLIEAYWIDQETGVANSFPETVVSSGAVTINPPTFGWVTSLRAYTNAYAGDIATPSWIDNSGTLGNRMVTDSTGTLTWAPANLCLWSQKFADAVWGSKAYVTDNFAAAPDGTQTAAKINNTGAADNVAQTVTVVPGVKYLFSFYAKNNGGTTSSYRVYNLTGSADIVATTSYFSQINGTTWTRVTVPFTAPAGCTQAIVYVSAANGSTENVLVWGAQVEPVTYQTRPRAHIPTTSAAVFMPRYDFDAATTPARPLGCLIEESRSNLLLYSQSFATWALNSINVTTGVIAPDGTTSGNALTFTSTTAIMFQSANVTAGQAYTASIWLKGSGASIGKTARFWIWYAGTATGSNAIVDVVLTGVWQRVTVSSTPTGSGSVYVRLDPEGINTSVSGDVVHAWGAQFEAGAFATSYIPTTTGTSLRVADVVKLTGTALSVAGAATGSAIVQTGIAPAAPWVLTSGNSRRLVFANGNTLAASFNGSVVLPATIGGSGNWTTGVVRSAIGWDANGRSIVANNGTAVTDANTLGTGVNVFLGSNGSSFFANCRIESLALYNTRLPDATLKQKSAVGAAY